MTDPDRPTFDVVDFGAVGDGVHNDRVAIQAALDQARDQDGTVILPAGRTFLSGDLAVHSRTTLRIDGVLRQSQRIDDYTRPPVLRHRFADAPHPSYCTWFHNPPLVMADSAHDVCITGAGTLEMTHDPRDVTEPGHHRGLGDDHHTIHTVPIAVHRVDRFEISELSIHYGNTHHVLVYFSRNGVVRNLDIQIYPTPESVGRHHVSNTDAVQVQSSQHIRVTGNHFDQVDNTVVVISRYHDPRDTTAWWSSAEPAPTRDVEIDHNLIRTTHGGVVLLPWGPGAPDLSRAEIRDIRVHHNTFEVGIQPLQIREDYVYAPGPSRDSHSPITQLQVHDNDYPRIDTHDRHLTRRARVTDWVNDFGQRSHHTFLNARFDHQGAYWRTDGAVEFRPDPDGYHAHLEATDGVPAVLGQGLGLLPGVPYRLTARVRGTSLALLVGEPDSEATVAQSPTWSGDWNDCSLDFRTDRDCASHLVGLRCDGDAEVAWLRLEPLTRVIEVDDPAVRLTGHWMIHDDVNLYGRRYAETEQAATASLEFTGTRAWWVGLRDWVFGRAEVWVDGAHRGTVDGFNDGSWPAWVDGQVLCDTGPLEPGRHTVRFECTGERHAGAVGHGFALEAALIETAAGRDVTEPVR